ncbi:MAG: hypothetical protein QM728_02495 [Gordonia sp. (in: high G+C Gram-positive bacteria)]|uniref:hypothetical protein n=1 Tax=Gordonia sp. (in: high G+C Gram-positive bacteria) TaxID=84139 RepID=UPI0039E29392
MTLLRQARPLTLLLVAVAGGFVFVKFSAWGLVALVVAFGCGLSRLWIGRGDGRGFGPLQLLQVVAVAAILFAMTRLEDFGTYAPLYAAIAILMGGLVALLYLAGLDTALRIRKRRAR